MSAANWDICPVCKARAEEEWAQRVAEHAASYGVVDARTFTTTATPLESGMPRPERTFREDYEIYGASSGTVMVSYSGSCTKCGLSIDFKEPHRLWPVGAGN